MQPIFVPRPIEIAQWSVSIAVFFLSLVEGYIVINKQYESTFEPYDPLPESKWFWQVDPDVRSIEEPPPNDIMKEELALYQCNQGPWPSWYISWNYATHTWDWGRGWRRHGLPPPNKRKPASQEDKWYWQEDPVGQLPNAPPPNVDMVNDKDDYDNRAKIPWPSWYLVPVLQPDGSLIWGQDWIKEREPELPAWYYAAPPPNLVGINDKNYAFKTVFSFLMVYFLVMMADWVHGPYIYAVYKEMRLSEVQISSLFGVDLLSALVTGKFVGLFADYFGRKRACGIFCAAYFVSCCSMVLPSCMGYISMPVLIGGRLFRGIATNILYSAFDTWFIEEYDRLKLRKLGYNIGRIFGYLTLIKAVSAFLSGILSELIVALAGDKGWTMVTSAFLLAVAFILIQTTWVENYGRPTSFFGVFNTWNNPTVAALQIVSMVFNVSLDLFTLLWAQTLEYQSPKVVYLPHLVIYNTFLGFTVLGALVSNVFISTAQVLKPSNALTIAFLGCAASLSVPFFARSDITVTFTVFCIFRICIGIISPMISQILYRSVPNSSRADVYAIFHLPFFQWVHWIDYTIEYFCGPSPHQSPEHALLILAVIMAVTGIFWLIISNGIQVFTVANNSIPPPSGANSAPSNVKDKLNRLRAFLGSVFQGLGSKTKGILSYLVHNGLPQLGGLALSCFSGIFLTVGYAFLWVGQKTRQLLRWAFWNGRFPKFDMGSPPASPLAGYGAPPPTSALGRDFRTFYRALGRLAVSIIFFVTIFFIVACSAYIASIVPDWLLGTNISGLIAKRILYVFYLARDILFKTYSSVLELVYRGWSLGKHAVPSIFAFSLGSILTCTSVIIRTLEGFVSYAWSKWESFTAALLSVGRLINERFNWVAESSQSIIEFFPERSYIGRFSKSIRDISSYIGTLVSETVIDRLTKFAIYLFDISVESVASLTSSFLDLVPSSWSRAFGYISGNCVRYLGILRHVLLKNPEWKSIFDEYWLGLGISLLCIILVIYLIPWFWLFELATKVFNVYLSILTTVGRAIWWILTICMAIITLPYHFFKYLYSMAQNSLANFYNWIYRNATATHNAIPGVIDPFLYGTRFFWRLLKYMVGKFLIFLGRAILWFTRSGTSIVYSAWIRIEATARWTDALIRWLWHGIERLGSKYCQAWTAAGEWLVDTGVEISRL